MTCCWWCCHPFEGEEYHMPYKYDDRRNKFSTTGIFCSWSCMKALAIDKYGTTKGGQICQYITLMRKRATSNLSCIHRAPNRFNLKMFGGTLTIEEFRNVSKDNFPVLQMPNESHIMPHLSKYHRETDTPSIGLNTDSSARNLRDKMNEINNSSSRNEPLRLKRPKPLKRDENNLEKTLGIVRSKKK